jgi:MATE family multidrug resistance protein
MVIAFMPNYGFSIAAGSMIGNAIGANEPQKAQRIGNISLCIATCIGGLVGSSLYFGRHHWGHLFSDDLDVLLLTSSTLPVVCCYIFLDNLGPGSLINILRGMNFATTPAILTFIAFYGIGIPVGLYLTFKRTHENWDIIGLWSGLVLGMFFMVSSLLFFLFVFADWSQAAKSAFESAKREALKKSSSAGSTLAGQDTISTSFPSGDNLLLAVDDVELS